MGRPPLTEVLLDRVRNMESFHLEIEGYHMYLFLDWASVTKNAYDRNEVQVVFDVESATVC